MAREAGPEGAPDTFTDEERARGQDLFGLDERERREALAWVGENLPYVWRSALGQHFLYWSLGIGFVIGVAVHVVGYVLKSSTTTEPLGLVADLLYALGFALWTGVVVALFLQVIPEAKRRQLKRALDAYEAATKPSARGRSTGRGDEEGPGRPPGAASAER
jgi:hypothetical protein